MMWINQTPLPPRMPVFLLALISLFLPAAPAWADERSAAIQSENNDSGGRQRAISFSGVDVSKDAYSFYSGALVALNGDFSLDGFIFRVIGISGDYEYAETSVPGGRVDADETAFDVMIGYQRTIGLITATAYVGYALHDIDLSPADPGNDVQGTQSGFKGALDAETSDEIPLFASFSGNYSTAFDAYSAMLRLGYNMSNIVVGFEGLTGAIDGSGYQRLGGFLTYRFNFTPALPVELTVNAGHQFVEDDDDGGFNTPSGGEGAYGGIGVSFSF